jgi:chromosome segregation ATPase
MEIEKFKKNNPVCYFPEVKLDMFAERCEEITGKRVDDLKNFTEFVENAVETALGSVKHVTSKLSEADKSKAALQSEIAELKKENDEKTKSFEQNKLDTESVLSENKDLNETIAKLQKENETLRKAKQEPEQRSENDLIIRLSDVQKDYLDEVTETKCAVKFCNDESNEFVPKIDAETNTKAGNFLLAWAFYGAKYGKYPFGDLDFRKWLAKRKK